MATELGSLIDQQSVLFITGCSTGVGRELGKQLLARGNSVTVTASKPESLSAFAHMEEAFMLGLDVTGPAAIAGAVHEAGPLFSRIEVLLNKAGMGYLVALEGGEGAEIRRMFDSNLFGVAAVTRSVLPGMRKRRQSLIVNISSIGGLRPFPGVGRNIAVQSAVKGLSDALCLEVNLLGIRVMLVEPSGFHTEWAGCSADASKSLVADYQATTGAGRAGVRVLSGRQARDPVWAVEAIIKLVEGVDPPRHLVLGNEAYYAAMAELTDPQNDLVRREAGSRGADFPTDNTSTVARSALASGIPHRRSDIPVPGASAADFERRTFNELVVGNPPPQTIRNAVSSNQDRAGMWGWAFAYGRPGVRRDGRLSLSAKANGNPSVRPRRSTLAADFGIALIRVV